MHGIIGQKLPRSMLHLDLLTNARPTRLSAFPPKTIVTIEMQMLFYIREGINTFRVERVALTSLHRAVTLIRIKKSSNHGK